MKRSDIKLLVKPGHYAPDCEWTYFVDSWTTSRRGIKIVVPDFQRYHVWTQEQQISYIENMLRGIPLEEISIIITRHGDLSRML